MKSDFTIETVTEKILLMDIHKTLN